MTDFDDVYDENENEVDDTGSFFKTGGLRDSTIFLVDCSPSMFEHEVEDEEKSYFEKCISAIQNMYQEKIYGSDKDMLSVVFFGTEKQNRSDEFHNVYALHDLEQPSAERIKQLEALSKKFNYKLFKSTYGHSDKFSLDNVLWCCSDMFSTVKQKLDTRRIILFTRCDNPHSNNKELERLAKNRAKDLADVSINLQIIPLLNEHEKFDYTKFYADMLMLSPEEVELIPDPREDFKELNRTLRSKDHKKRPYTHLHLKISDDLSIGCNLFNLIRACPKPTKVKLDKATNMETKTVTRRYLEETGEILFNSDVKFAIDVTKDKRVTFEQDEVKTIKRFGTAGMKLIGFKPISSLKPHYYVKPGHFLYPDEKTIEGSSTMFHALLVKCLEKEKYILCEIIARANTAPRLVALVPQAEELDEYKIQVTPPGFHVIYMPYADDFRQIDKTSTETSSTDQISAFKKCIKKLKFSYSPANFKNPAIQKIWNEIEAIALERETPEEVVDLTIPDIENIERRAGQELEEFVRLCFPDGQPTDNKSKRKPTGATSDTASNKKAKTDGGNDLDVSKLATAGQLSKLTIPQLKEFMKSKNIKCSGTKKQDLIDAINEAI